MDKNVHCEKCGAKFNNRNHRKKHMKHPCGDEVKFSPNLFVYKLL